jgi:hypothetical protein
VCGDSLIQVIIGRFKLLKNCKKRRRNIYSVYIMDFDEEKKLYWIFLM